MKKITFSTILFSIVAVVFAQNPIIIKDVYTGATGSGIQQIVKTSNYTFFNAEDDDADLDRGLYRTDGTTAGTLKLNLVYPGYISSKAEKLTAIGNKIVFAGDNVANYGEIWSSDGTQAGTIAIERFQPTLTGVTPVMDMAVLGNEVLYSVVNSSNRSLLKKTDGTIGGTSVIYDFSSLNRAVDLQLFKTINNILYFNLFDLSGTGYDQLWRSDGTPSGTYMIKDFGANHFVASYYMSAGNLFYMIIVQPGTGNVLWKSDGTTSGTVALKTIGTSGNNNYPAFAAIGNTLYFAGIDGNGKELWKTDGTEIGTVMVSDINPGTASSNPLNLTFFNNSIYFSATTATEGTELWKFDGNVASLVKDINPGLTGSSPNFFVVSNNTIMFRAAEASSGSELWITDGTSANTLQAADINLGVANSSPSFLTPGNPIYFSANNGVNGAEIFKYDNSDGISGLHKIYVNDNSTSADIFTTAVGNDTNQGTKAAPVLTISKAIAIAQVGDIIYVDSGTYTEQSTIDKGITIIGAGQNLTSILKPAVTVSPPGAFTEQGVIQTAQNIGDVHISNLSIVADYTINVTPIILQTGGSVKNCLLQNGNQGIFVRVDPSTNPTVKSVLIENNTINAEYIGVNFAGTNLTASLINNNLSTINIGFSAGVFAGLDFGSLPQLTVTGNTFNNYATYGLLVNSLNTTITQNSFIGSGIVAIQKNGGNTINATCNWYGSTDAAIVVPKLSSGVLFNPWLSNGTDNDMLTIGFQPVPDSCNGRQNTFYVNDNSLTGDVFSSSIGNDSNSGIPSAPLLTINAALLKAQSGDTIYVDAGTYALAENLTINKSITIIGSNHLISPNDAIDRAKYNTTRNSESIITGATILIGADFINFKGLRFSPNATAISLFADYSHVKFDKNYFDVVNAQATLNLQGVSSSPIVAFDFSVTDCRFERKNILEGSSINLGLVKSIWIDNNIFIETPTVGGPYRGIGIRTAPGQSVENVVFSNNYIKNLAIGVLPSIAQDFVINNNIFDTCFTGYQHTPNAAISNNIFIRTNTFIDMRLGRSILVRGGANGGINNLNIIDNTINQQVDGINGIVGMIQLDFAAANSFGAVSVLGNRVNVGGNYETAVVKTNCGIILIGKHSNTTISENEFNFSAINFQNDGLNVLPNMPTGIFINTDNGITSGPIPLSAVINIVKNKINGFQNSVGIYDPSATGLNSFVGYGNLTSGAVVNLNNNSFTNDSISINNGDIGQSINATCNWYGSTDAAIVVPKLSSGVLFNPWLSNGTDNDMLTIGFQPVPDSCNGKQDEFYVNDNSLTGDVFSSSIGNDSNSGIPSAPLLTINAALLKVQSGDTIYVDAGTYALVSDLTINKEITILGSNYLLSPNSLSDKKLINSERNTESVITNATLILGTNNISLQGLTFDPGVPIGVYFVNATCSNISLLRNRMIMNSGNAAIRFDGLGSITTNTASLINANISIDENRFERFFTGTGLAINASLLKSISITNNSFVITGSTLRNYTVFNSGSNGVNDTVLFSGNFVENAATVITGSRNANLLVTNNKIFNSTSALSMTNSLSESSIVELSNNILDGSGGILPFINYTRTGGNNFGSSSVFKVENNTISGTAVAGITSLLGSMNLIFNNSVLNPSLIVRGNSINYRGDFSSVEGQFIRPIMLRGNLLNAIVEKNEITLDGTNLQPANPLNVLPESPAITLYSDNGVSSVIPSAAVINILNNKIQGFKHSFIVFDPIVTGSSAYVGFGNLASGVTVNVNNNSFTGDMMSINNGEVGQLINATCNWYGSSAAQNVNTKVTPKKINYSPWLTTGIDLDETIGFEPVPNSCNGSPLSASLDEYADITCNGKNDGSINITVTSGVAPYSFVWVKEEDAAFSSNSEDPKNLAPGTYSVTITDASGTNILVDSNGNFITIEVSIVEPDLLTATSSGTNNLCFGASAGSASVTSAGGTAPYTYLWSNGGTTDEISNLLAGLYTVTVTDANGCTQNASYEVTDPSLLVATILNNSTTCNNIAMVTADGGTPEYTYLWSNGATSASISSVPVGTYSVTVTDANGCSAIANVTLSVGEAFNPSASVTNVSCFNGNNGVISVTNANGTPPFTFSIDGGNFSQGVFPFNFNNLTAGNYTVAVRDANGCTGFVTKTITQPALLSVTLNTVQSTCAGQTTGSITVTASGGSGAFGYSWTGPNGYISSQKNQSNLATGTYTLMVTDNSGCTTNLNVVVPTFNSISLNSVVTNILCKGEANGAINITATGGTGNGFSYSWTGTVTSSNEDLSNLSKGNYNLLITDIGSGCTVSASYIVTEPASNLAFSISKTNATGCNSLGTVVVTASGGTSPYTYNLNGGSYGNTSSFTSLYAGNYTIGVKDANGCLKTTLVTITDNGSDAYESNNSKNQAKLISIANEVNARIALSTDIADWFKFTTAGAGNYVLNMFHPTVNYTFNLFTAGNNTPALTPVLNSATSKQYNNLAANTTYYIQITGGLSYACYSLSVEPVIPSIAKMVTVGKVLDAEIKVSILKAITYPNPHNGSFDIKIESPVKEEAKIELFSVNGQLLAKKIINLEVGDNNILPFRDMYKGIIFYRIQVGNQFLNGKIIGDLK